MVADHDADVAIGGRPPEDGRLVGAAFLPNEIVLVTAPDDPLAARRSVPVRELADRHWLLREEGSGTRTMIEEFLAAHELRPKALTLGSNGAIKQAAATRLGVSLQSRVAVALELASGLLATIDLREQLPEREWYVLHAAVGPARPLAEAFEAFVAGPEGRAALAG
jgi:DNA-binding transcriptional LysR family regulator